MPLSPPMDWKQETILSLLQIFKMNSLITRHCSINSRPQPLMHLILHFSCSARTMVALLDHHILPGKGKARAILLVSSLHDLDSQKDPQATFTQLLPSKHPVTPVVLPFNLQHDLPAKSVERPVTKLLTASTEWTTHTRADTLLLN
jgi:hypothetical protein